MALEIYTDGASRGNPGPGGYGILLKWGEKMKEISAGYRMTTNNRMELLAVIVALESLTRDGVNITIYSDSKYVVDSVEKRWIWGWQQKGWAGKKNVDLWQKYIALHNKHNIRFVWVKGHANNPYNNRCDILATTAADGRNLLVDAVYEAEMLGQ